MKEVRQYGACKTGEGKSLPGKSRSGQPEHSLEARAARQGLSVECESRTYGSMRGSRQAFHANE